jgi:hypothetical protein
MLQTSEASRRSRGTHGGACHGVVLEQSDKRRRTRSSRRPYRRAKHGRRAPDRTVPKCGRRSPSGDRKASGCSRGPAVATTVGRSASAFAKPTARHEGGQAASAPAHGTAEAPPSPRPLVFAAMKGKRRAPERDSGAESPCIARPCLPAGRSRYLLGAGACNVGPCPFRAHSPARIARGCKHCRRA